MNHNVDSMGVSQFTIFSLCQMGKRERETEGDREREERREGDAQKKPERAVEAFDRVLQSSSTHTAYHSFHWLQ